MYILETTIEERPNLNAENCESDTLTTMKTFACSLEQAEDFKVNLVKVMVTGCVLFTFEANEDMKQGMQSVGTKIPSRKELDDS
jgi:hypothetical protein